MTECFVVTSGDYSDYCIHAIFEREEDALAYVRGYNLNHLRSRHEGRQNWTNAYGSNPCVGHSFASCPECQQIVRETLVVYKGADPVSLADWHYRVERYGFHPAGEVPLTGE